MTTTVKDIKAKTSHANPEKKEGKVAVAIEEQTSRLPSDLFLWASLGTLAVSLTLKTMKKDNPSLFIGMCANAFLLFGIYNKMVKLMGHDSKS